MIKIATISALSLVALAGWFHGSVPPPPPGSATLSSATNPTSPLCNSMSISVSTDTGSGTAYYVITNLAGQNPTATQIKASHDGTGGAPITSGTAAVSSTGVKSFTTANSGPDASTDYYIYFAQDVGGVLSNVATPGSAFQCVLARSQVATTGNLFIDGLMWAPDPPDTGGNGAAFYFAGTRQIITFSFPANTGVFTSASQYNCTVFTGNPCNQLNGFQVFSAGQKAATRQILLDYAKFLPVTFVEVTESITQHATIRYWQRISPSNQDSTTYALNQFYCVSTRCQTRVDIAIAVGVPDPVRGDLHWQHIMHETGHALGQNHTDTNGYADFPSGSNAQTFTQMSYKCFVGGSDESCSPNAFIQTPMRYDIQSIQQAYGLNTTSATRNWSWSPTTGVATQDGVARDTPTGNIVYETVYNPGGSFTLDFSSYTTAIVADLTPGNWINLGAQIATTGFPNQFAPGNINMSMAAGSHLMTSIITGSGNDDIKGNAANNTIDGGSGTNTYRALDTFGNSSMGALSGGYCPLTSPADGTDQLKNIQIIIFSGGVTKSLNMSTCGLS